MFNYLIGYVSFVNRMFAYLILNFPYFRKLRNYSWRKVAFEYVQFVWKYNVFSANIAMFPKNANLFSLSISTARSDEPVIVVPVVVKTRPTVCHAV